jgi:hypothetical protein
MTGFSADWLALREPADHAARSEELLAAVAAHFADRRETRIVDLACGACSNLRALAPRLGPRQAWRAIDYDAGLLDAARRRLVEWADSVTHTDPLRLVKAGREIEVAFAQRDLAAPSDDLFADVDLVTAAALFDLVSTSWIERFCDLLAARRLPLYAALTYSGEEVWSPPHSADAEMLAAFHAHQARDKGFGPAAGPRAPEALRTALAARGYAVRLAPSAWRPNGGEHRALIAALAESAAAAVLDTGLVAQSAVRAWETARRNAEHCDIGHVDLFATPA